MFFAEQLFNTQHIAFHSEIRRLFNLPTCHRNEKTREQIFDHCRKERTELYEAFNIKEQERILRVPNGIQDARR
jgi:hypothetical protein